MSPRNHADCIGSYCNAILTGHFRSLLAQFGLTPKSKRGLDASEAVIRSIYYPVIADCPFTPIRIKHAATITALVRLFSHRIIDWHSQQFATVRALHFRGARDGSRKAGFVGDDVVGEGH